MAAAPEKSQLQTASEVQWSDGTPFQGSLLLVLALPTLAGETYGTAFLKGSDVHQWRIPTRIKVPIVDGVMSSDVRVWQNADIEPPKTVYCGFWYDATDNNIVTEAPQLVEIAADPYTITVPTLTVPTVASTCPSLASLDLISSSSVLLSASILTVETATGTGSSVTLASPPSLIVGLWYNGILLKPTTDYTVSGNTITFVNITAVSGETRVVYYS